MSALSVIVTVIVVTEAVLSKILVFFAFGCAVCSLRTVPLSTGFSCIVAQRMRWREVKAILGIP